LRRLVDLVERRVGVHLRHRVVQHLGDGRRERRLAVVDVADRADVAVRLGPLELGLTHWSSPSGVIRQVRTTTCSLGYSPRAFFTISSATLRGTSAYESNCIV